MLAQRGYTLGRNLTFQARASVGQAAKLPLLLQEFKASGVDAIVTIGYPPALAAKASGIPTVVAYGAGDPMATGLIDSLARPGGSLTGISDMAAPLSVKRLSLLKELLPNASRVAMLWNRDDLIDRIFKGAKPSELPFEHPTRYPFVINLKTARAIGLDFPPNLLARADEVIE